MPGAWPRSPDGGASARNLPPFALTPLRGLLFCSCGTRMRGEAHLQRGTERRYYRCPTLGCRARRSFADDIENEVLATISDAVLPPSVVDTARSDLHRRLATPELATSGRQRERLLTRLEQLKKQHGWGDLTDADYQAQRDRGCVAWSIGRAVPTPRRAGDIAGPQGRGD